MRNFERNKFSKVVDEEVNSIVKNCFEVLMSELDEKYRRLIGQILEQDISYVDPLATGQSKHVIQHALVWILGSKVYFDGHFLRGPFKRINNIFK